jgi:lipoprotein NlpI
MQRLLAGDKDSARALFQEAINAKSSYLVEYGLARVELRRLDPSPANATPAK